MKVLQLLGKAWKEFRESYAGLSEAELLKPGVTGEWSVRDIIAHVTTWEEETLKHLPGMLQGKKYPRYSVVYGGLNEFNALMTANKKNFFLSEVFRQQEQVHGHLLLFLESVPEEYLDSRTRFRHRLRMDTYSHYPKHARAIRKWKDELRSTNDELTHTP
jgi:hypothetical protein